MMVLRMPSTLGQRGLPSFYSASAFSFPPRGPHLSTEASVFSASSLGSTLQCNAVQLDVKIVV
ncbi:hypothetical protein C2845_PM07G12000 [Panicum miliaceum]|uniref:Uncharacterized protein n=1 Tax=Panicum miliaceum TaxID=4540 RepID=A0A3L6SQA5_PANMI|nr:hypothetical protein C2845_PM07G12000 [Panicum miliaceum]